MTYNLRAIEDLMKAIPVSYETLSEKTDLSVSALKNHVHRVSNPPLSAIIKIADFFQVPIDILVGRCSEEEYENFIKGFKPEFMKLEQKSYETYLLKRYGAGIYIIPNENIKPNDYIAPYPYNLLDTVFKEPIQFLLTEDQLAGVEAVINTLMPREVEYLKLYYKEGRTLREIAQQHNLTQERVRQILAKAIRKLRHPSRTKSMFLGANFLEQGNEWTVKKQALIDEYIEEQRKWERKIQELREAEFNGGPGQVAVPEQGKANALDILNLSVRSYNCLCRALGHQESESPSGRWIVTIDELIEYARAGKLLLVRNLGKKSAIEILSKLELHTGVSLWSIYPEYKRPLEAS